MNKDFFYKILLRVIKKIIPEKKQFTMRGALSRCVSRGMHIETVIDIGASDGRWSQACMDFYPNANYLLVEANNYHEERLKKKEKSLHNLGYIIAAAGEKEGTIYFDNSDPFGGLASESKIEGSVEVPVISIDQEVSRRMLKAPYLLKLDTHGFEVPILKGAEEVIKGANLIIIESYNFPVTESSLKYYELCQFMSDIGFFPIEIADLMLRGYDGALWQMDTFFAPSSSSEFKYTKFL